MTKEGAGIDRGSLDLRASYYPSCTYPSYTYPSCTYPSYTYPSCTYFSYTTRPPRMLR